MKMKTQIGVNIAISDKTDFKADCNERKKKQSGDILQDLIRTAGIIKARRALGDYLKSLKTEFPTGMIFANRSHGNPEAE